MAEFKPEDLEAAKWGQEVDTIARKFVDTERSILADAAGRGFCAAPGAALQNIQDVALAAKAQLTEANTELYAEQMDRAFKEEDTQQKVVFGLAKLDAELYKAEVDNALLIEKAESDMTLNERRAMIEEMKSDVDKRQAAIIEEKADIEHEVNYWKLQAIEAEGLALDAELQLAREKVKTAEEKLKVINALYEVIAAEQLVLLAEQRRAATLQKVVEAEKQVAEIQKTMIPYMIQKADARLVQAEAIKEEAYAKKEIEELGYRRIELKQQQEDAEHQLRGAELALEQSREEAIRWELMIELARQQSRRALVDYETAIKEEIIPREETLRKEEKRFDVARRLFWQNYESRNSIRMLDLSKKLAIVEAQKRIANILKAGKDRSIRVVDSSKRTEVLTTNETLYHYISKG